MIKKKKKAPKRVNRKFTSQKISLPLQPRKVRRHQGGKGATEKPSLAQTAWNAAVQVSPLKGTNFFLLHVRLNASKLVAAALHVRPWEALPLWARRGLKKLAARKPGATDMTEQEAAYYGYETTPAPTPF